MRYPGLDTSDKRKTPQEGSIPQKWNSILISDNHIGRIWLDTPVGKPFWLEGTPISIAQEGEVAGTYAPWDLPPTPKRTKGDEGLASFLPEDLYDLLDWSLLRPVYKFNNGLLDKLSSGLMIAMVVILLFFVYLIYSTQTGG